MNIRGAILFFTFFITPALVRASPKIAGFSLDNAIKYWYFYSASLCDPLRLQKWDVGVISEKYPNSSDVIVVYNKTGEALAYVSYDSGENSIYTVFRGTIEKVENWVDDANLLLTNYPDCSNCKVDAGFYNHYLDLKDGIFDNIQSLLVKYPSAVIRIIGHSLGATGATLLAIDVKRNFDSFESLYTYGSPRVGNKDFAEWWNMQMKEKFTARITHKHDPVPHLPPQLLGYQHVSTEYFYPSDNLDDLINCSPLVEDDKCSNQYYFDLNVNDHITYMNQSCKELRMECQKSFSIES